MTKVTPQQYTLTNRWGMQIQLMDYGATLTAVKVPVPNAPPVDITLGFNNLSDYHAHPFYFGATIGRVANRIRHGKFALHGQPYQVTCNENATHHLHGGAQGFDKVYWQGTPNANQVSFAHRSPAGTENYPGEVAALVSYELTDENEIIIRYQATTSAATLINLTNHAYWNLAGAGMGDILGHEVEIAAQHYVASDAAHIPTGALHPVQDTAFDFRRAKPIGQQMASSGGYDHCYALSTALCTAHAPRFAARVREPVSGRLLEVYTDQPGMQFYTGNYLTDYALAADQRCQRWGGFCLETQDFPDAINHPQFPSILLTPAQCYQRTTIYRLHFAANG